MKSYLTLLSCFCFGLLSVTAKAGQLKLEQTLVEITPEGEELIVTADFPFTVEGEGKAEILRFDIHCSCLEAELSDNGRQEWAPGERGIIRGHFKVGNFRGTVDKQMTVVMSDKTRHALTVRLVIPEYVKIEPKTLRWAVGEAVEKKAFEITMHGPDPLKIINVVATNEVKFPFEMETLEEGKHYRVWVTPTETEIRGMGLIRFTTDSEDPRQKSYQGFAAITHQPVRGQAPE